MTRSRKKKTAPPIEGIGNNVVVVVIHRTSISFFVLLVSCSSSCRRVVVLVDADGDLLILIRTEGGNAGQNIELFM